MSKDDPAHADSYAVQIARFKAGERRLDAGCAVLGVAWLVLTRLAGFVGGVWWLAAFAGAAAVGAGWWALRWGDGRLANRVNDEIFETKDD